ncbi:pbcR Transcription factor pbcR [Candida maltosa Xu316]
MSETTPSDSTTSSTTTTSSSLANGGEKFAAKWRLTRACARCRRLKMKCSFEDPSFKSCVRCFQSGIECSMDVDPTAQFARKKRKKDDGGKTTEKSMDEKLLASSQSLLSSIYNKASKVSHSTLHKLISNHTMILDNVMGMMIPDGDAEFPEIPFTENLMKQLIFKHKFITIPEVKLRFEFFLNEILPYFPIIPFSAKLRDFDHLFENYPLLLVACISVTTVNDNHLGLTPSTQNNFKLCNLLTHYLYPFIAHYVYVKCDDFNIQLLYVCLILSAWCVPPVKMGYFRNQLNSMTAANIALCMALNELPKNHESLPVDDNSELRNNLRAFMSVYANCGGMEISLSRFKLVQWTKAQEVAIEVLLRPMSDDGMPTFADKFVCYYGKMISIGQEILQFLNHLDLKSQAANNHVFTMANIKYIILKYEFKLSQVVEQGMVAFGKEHLIMKIEYYHLLININDNLLGGVINMLEHPHNNTTHNLEIFNSNQRELFLELIIKTNSFCTTVIELFITLNNQTINFPTVYYFRPLHALMLLIRLRLILKFLKMDDFKIEVESLFDKMTKLIDENIAKGSLVGSRIKIITTKIEKWMQLSQRYKFDTNKQGLNTNFHSSDVVKIIIHNRNKEIENLDVPKSTMDSNPSSPVPNNNNNSNPLGIQQHQQHHHHQGGENANLEQIFEGIDFDISHLINPFETNFYVDQSTTSEFPM